MRFHMSSDSIFAQQQLLERQLHQSQMIVDNNSGFSVASKKKKSNYQKNGTNQSLEVLNSGWI